MASSAISISGAKEAREATCSSQLPRREGEAIDGVPPPKWMAPIVRPFKREAREAVSRRSATKKSSILRVPVTR
nr:hypothetical protein [Chlorobium phaeovibrioides]